MRTSIQVFVSTASPDEERLLEEAAVHFNVIVVGREATRVCDTNGFFRRVEGDDLNHVSAAICCAHRHGDVNFATETYLES